MKNRMDRYSSPSNLEDTPSRLERNKDLYDDLYSTVKYTEIIDLENNQPYELNKDKVNNATREKYQRLKEYKNLINREYKEDKVRPTIDEEPKVYDINVILEEAKKDREEPSSNEDYHQFAEVSGIFKDGKSDEIQELIDTITSRSLRKDLDQKIKQEGLLSDLLPEEGSETALLEPLKVEDPISDEDIIDDQSPIQKPQIDKTFYTKSLEFSTKDFETNNKKDQFDESKKSNIYLKVFTVLSVLLIIGALLFVIIKYIL